jgi:hypothetical protein
MFLFNRKKRESETAKAEKKVKALDSRVDRKVQAATEETEKLERLIEEARQKGDVTLLFFLALGGDRRMK